MKAKPITPPNQRPPRPMPRQPDRDDPLPKMARDRRAYTDFLSLCLYPGMPRRTEAMLPGVAG